MSKLATVVAIVALSACATRTGKIAGVVAGTSGVLAGASFAAASGCDHSDCELMNRLGGITLLGVAGVALLTAAVAEARHASAPVEKPLLVRAAPPRQPTAPRTPASPAVVELMVSASVEASVGRCVTVRELATRVRQLDPEFYANVFRVDPAIQRCDR